MWHTFLPPRPLYWFLPFYTAISKWLEEHVGNSRIAQTVAITGITYLALQNYLIGVVKMMVSRVCGPAVFDTIYAEDSVIALVVMAILYPLAVLIERLPFPAG